MHADSENDHVRMRQGQTCRREKKSRPGGGSAGAELRSGSAMGRRSFELTTNGVRLTQFSVIFRVKLTDFRVVVGPEWGLAMMGPFPSRADPGVLRVIQMTL